MELLVNALMKQGAQRDRLKAKLFGGARMMRGLSDIGLRNAKSAEHYLKHEGITVVGKDLGGQRGRHLQYVAGFGSRQAKLCRHERRHKRCGELQGADEPQLRRRRAVLNARGRSMRLRQSKALEKPLCPPLRRRSAA